MAVEGAICKAPEGGPFGRKGKEGQCAEQTLRAFAFCIY